MNRAQVIEQRILKWIESNHPTYKSDLWECVYFAAEYDVSPMAGALADELNETYSLNDHLEADDVQKHMYVVHAPDGYTYIQIRNLKTEQRVGFNVPVGIATAD